MTINKTFIFALMAMTITFLAMSINLNKQSIINPDDVVIANVLNGDIWIGMALFISYLLLATSSKKSKSPFSSKPISDKKSV